jgi:hypothetical protein
MLVRYSTLLYATLRYSTLLYATLRYSTLLYATLRYSMLLYATLLYATHTLIFPQDIRAKLQSSSGSTVLFGSGAHGGGSTSTGCTNDGYSELKSHGDKINFATNNYPDNYEDNDDCKWGIYAPDASRLIVHFEDIDVGPPRRAGQETRPEIIDQIHIY